ncbi:hypothetical protein PQX77_017515 [Marasmius sp. AFHP31]|nr:hypothetical protein PQX77_017515 [Marasmius sp. AFHP31]
MQFKLFTLAILATLAIATPTGGGGSHDTVAIAKDPQAAADDQGCYDDNVVTGVRRDVGVGVGVDVGVGIGVGIGVDV